MAQYLLSVMQPTGGTPDRDALETIMRDLDALNEELRAAGAWVFAGGLHGPESSTVVRAQGDGVLTTDGPFAEAKEHLGGISIIEAADLDEALRWAGGLPRLGDRQRGSVAPALSLPAGLAVPARGSYNLNSGSVLADRARAG